MKEEITTKAALCPQCKQFHIIASIDAFNKSKDVRNDFSKLMKNGFQVLDVSTDEAKNRFGYCENKSHPVKMQISLF